MRTAFVKTREAELDSSKIESVLLEMLQELAHRKNKSQIVDTQTRLLTYLAANWHLLNSDPSNQTDDQKFWDSFALAC